MKMSFLDLATLTLHRRHEMEARINLFLNKCDHAINEIQKLKMQAQGFITHLNCEPAVLKERFLNCMKHLDEYTYLITDFNLSVGKLDETNSADLTPVLDSSVATTPVMTPYTAPVNLLDMLSESKPSTSSACSNKCPPEKPRKTRVPKEDQLLIAFSSTSCSSESVPLHRSEMVSKEVQYEIESDISNITIKDPPTPVMESCNLPAQQVLQVDQQYPATIMSMDGGSFWVITEDIDEVTNFMITMTTYYRSHRVAITASEISNLNYCAFYDDESVSYYRALFLRLFEEGETSVEVFLVDTGEVRRAVIDNIQPLAPEFCTKPPYARCCHLAGIELLSFKNKSLMEKQELFMREYLGTQCTIEVDDNSSESLGVYVILPSKLVLNDLLLCEELAVSIDKPVKENAIEISEKIDRQHGPPEMVHPDSELDITQCPEYDDPVEAVTGYSNRDEADICKHYKGGSSKTCFKGSKCTKKHVTKHPDGWTLDRVEIAGKLKSLPLPAPGTWHKVAVTYVGHFDRVFVQFVKDKVVEELPSFGVVLPPTTLQALVVDMNSPASRLSYKPLTLSPAPGELVAALYPLDNQWYRARVLTLSRSDQNVEVSYVDYGNVVWVKENEIRQLHPRFTSLPAQAVLCALAGVRPRSARSAQWAAAKQRLVRLTEGRALDAHVISRGYDELVVELYDQEGYSIAEQLAALDLVNLVEYSVEDDSDNKKRIVPA